MSDDIRIRRLAAGDWDDVVALEERAYAASGLSEGRAALESRGRASPDTCFALEHRGRFGGYLLALPYPLFHCPDLSRAEATGAAPAGRESNMHAHDLVIAEELRGRGLAPVMLAHLAETARERGFATISLVAVRGSDVLWTPLGYRADPGVVLPASYGDRAVYMSMPLRPSEPLPLVRAVADTDDPLAGSPPKVEVG
ncbi:GNAT family N-acetyltransferase [Kitasatospora sp. NPDC127111]|uniref:GNAT family N-acetyltransferase n=1 Tax=Kitasatospora sp. NPDC127111 TaxID=3345363 RepID=UPI00362BD32F